MHPPQQHSRVNLDELKTQILRKLGPEGSQQYFHCVNRFLNSKLSKVDFSKLCLRIVGRENIPLHNQFICSILKNACSAKAPPRTHDEEDLRSTRSFGSNQPSSDGYLQNGSHTVVTQTPIPSALSNGDLLPLSPKKVGTEIRERMFGDFRNSLGPNGKTNLVSRQLLTTNFSENVHLKNGYWTAPDYQRLVQHRQRFTQEADNNEEIVDHHLSNLSVINRSPDFPVSVHSSDKIELLVVENGNDLSARSPLRAPLGVPSWPVSVGGARKALPLSHSSNCITAANSGGLLDTVALRERMEHIALTQGLEGVSSDSAKLLNNGVDAYLKGLIRSCFELVGARSGLEPRKNIIQKRQARVKLINVIRPGHHYQIKNSSRPLETVQENRADCPVSLLDFRVAMELNPQQLGEDWPLLLEKICTHAFDE